jgi:hypothetical protein
VNLRAWVLRPFWRSREREPSRAWALFWRRYWESQGVSSEQQDEWIAEAEAGESPRESG